jgi:hypothetical protein
MTKQPSYKLIKREGHFDLRQYEAFTMMEASDQSLQSYQGFRLAFNFIQGENENNQKIAMTAPVINRLNDSGIETTSFVMPLEMNHDEVPLPKNKNLIKVFVPERICAVYRFSSNAKMEVIRSYENDLKSWIKQEGYTIKGNLQLARYNPPFIPGFLKKNELWFEVTKD